MLYMVHQIVAISRWTRSTWAFLNEPPVLDRPTNNYQPQFHVASLATSKFNKNSGISAN
ncbi:hypothetical protein Goklo_026427 [Gossypium klotzschianum]|uniref:Uncharacterized protein n=1 Tax=Gossypium klotzschianum TaxID=34286 RepID=A0A7J8TV07_9ROSI|nr:hypothetical protein [Gossypium klotzschianum]